MSETGKNPENDFDFEAYDETGDFEYDPDMDMGSADFDDLPAEEADMGAMDEPDMQTLDSDMDEGEMFDTNMDAAPVPPQKKSSLVFYLVLALVVLGGGFFIFSTFMSGPDIPPRTAQFDDLETPQQAANGEVPADNAGMGMPQISDMQADPNAAYPSDMAQLPDQAAPVDPNANTGLDTGADPLAQNNAFFPENDPAANQLEAQQQAVENTFDQQQDMNVAPVAEPPMAQDTTTGEPLPVNPEPMPQTNLVTATNIAETNAEGAIAPPAPSTGAADAQLNSEILSALNGIQDGIAQLRQTMNSLEIRVSALENAPAPEAAAAAPAPAAANTAEMEALQKDVKAMESKMGKLEDGMATQTAAVKEALALIKKQSQTAAAPKPVAVAKPAPSPTATKPTPAPTRAPEPAPAPAAASVSWKLQGAQPGKAWLTRTSGGEPVTVTTGAFLPGLGRINFIGQRNGRWMVEGSEGRVSE